MDLTKYKHIELTIKPMFMHIPVNRFNLNTEGVKDFNTIYLHYKKIGKKFNLIQGTGFPKNIYFDLPAYSIYKDCAGVVELVIVESTGIYRFQCRGGLKKENTITGSQAFRRFKKEAKRFGIDLNTYKIDNGKEVKETIETVLIKLGYGAQLNTILINCHHIDYHSSFGAGLGNTHPEFKKVMKYFYDLRKTDEECKMVLNASIGYMQSIACCGAKWAHLSKDAIADNNKRIRKMAQTLYENGRTLLLYNTDGIWYQGDIYHGEGEGDDIGDWHNDHVNCTLRIKSAGAYEFIDEDNKYYAVVRGHTLYDDIVPREEWKWGDIFRDDADAINYDFDEVYGIVEAING